MSDIPCLKGYVGISAERSQILHTFAPLDANAMPFGSLCLTSLFGWVYGSESRTAPGQMSIFLNTNGKDEFKFMNIGKSGFKACFFAFSAGASVGVKN